MTRRTDSWLNSAHAVIRDNDRAVVRTVQLPLPSELSTGGKKILLIDHSTDGALAKRFAKRLNEDPDASTEELEESLVDNWSLKYMVKNAMAWVAAVLVWTFVGLAFYFHY